MDKYNYYEEVKECVKMYLADNDLTIETIDEDTLYDDCFNEDSVTGNASGSFTFNTWQAEENLCHNLDLLAESLNEFGCTFDPEKGAEFYDVTIRCYVLSYVISELYNE